MIKLKKILELLEKKLESEVWGKYEEDLTIEHVDILKEDIVTVPNTLYLTKEMQTSTKGVNVLLIVDKIYKCSNTLQIKSGESTESIYNWINQFLINEYKLYAKKCNLYSVLYKCTNIDEILNVGESYLNNPIYILDTSYRIFAGSKGSKSIDTYTLKESDGTYLLTETINIMKKDKCMDSIYHSSEAFIQKAERNLIFSGIRVNNITVAYICVLEEYREFMQDDLELVNALAEVISLQMQKDNSFINKSGLEEEYYLMDLLMGRISDISYMEQRLRNIDFKINKNFQLISIPFAQIYQDYRHNFALRQLMNSCKNILGNCISAYYEDRIILMISSERDSLVWEDNLKENFVKFLKLNNLRAGVSSIFSNILEAKDFYVQAIYAIELSEQLRDEGHMVNFNDYLEYYLFHTYENGTKRVELRKMINPLVNKLVFADNNSNGELIKTLAVYLESNRNASIASKKLNIHCSTFFYRFHKIESLLGVSLNDSELLFKLELSLKILKYLKIIPYLN